MFLITNLSLEDNIEKIESQRIQISECIQW
jgi:hypothetical protein